MGTAISGRAPAALLVTPESSPPSSPLLGSSCAPPPNTVVTPSPSESVSELVSFERGVNVKDCDPMVPADLTSVLKLAFSLPNQSTTLWLFWSEGDVELWNESIDNGVATYGLCNYGDSSMNDGGAEYHQTYLFEERLDYSILLFDLSKEVFPFAR